MTAIRLDDKIKALQTQVNKNSDVIEEIVNKLVADYCTQLDDYMAQIDEMLLNEEQPITDYQLDYFALNLPVLLYFTGEAQEAIGLREDIAKAVRQEVFNNAFKLATGTIADKNAEGELATQAEMIVHVAHQRAYRKIKLRMEAANEMLQSIKKVISRRMVEYEISKVGPERISGLK